MQIINRGWQLLRRAARAIGPYMILELLLPGGTLFALLLYVYRSGALAALHPMPAACHPYAYCQAAVWRRQSHDLPTLSSRDT
jgi:hypothetical protein